MKPKIIKAFPPNFAAIKSTFPVVAGHPNIVYAWGDRIYNPSGHKLEPWLVAHEQVHLQQQRDNGGPERWWENYLQRMVYRYIMELPAHQEEYRAFCLHHDKAKDRDKYLDLISQRLSGPLYGRMETYENVIKAIKGK